VRAGEAGPGPVIVVGGGANVSGKEIMMLGLARGLRAARFDVRFITSIWSGNGDFIARLDTEGFKYDRARLGFISMSLSWKPFIWTFDQVRHWPSLVAAYRQIVRNAQPRAVIHTNWHHALLLLPWLDARRDIYWAHEVMPVNARYRRLFRAIANRVAYVVCVSKTVADSVRRLGVDHEKIVVVHNGTALDDTPDTRVLAMPVRLGIAGQVAEWKGHDDLVEAIARLDDRRSVVVSVFGRGNAEYVAALEQKAQRLGVADRIEWRGFVAATRDIYDEIDVCLVPSRFEEPFGLVALEAGMRGRAVIATRVGGLSEIVVDGETGLLVEPSRPDRLAAAISSLVNEPDRITAMGGAARIRCRREFSYERFIERFTEVIDRIGGTPRELRSA
jgi:glycosyltransferase involved in cell wall biosynthesis